MADVALQHSELALLGGNKAIDIDDREIFRWPVVTKAHEDAVLAVLRDGNMSGTDVTVKFQKKYAAEIGMKHGWGRHGKPCPARWRFTRRPHPFMDSMSPNSSSRRGTSPIGRNTSTR